ncbi:MAG TPA: hypothetical protein VMS76_18855 [Planctomycetota bacterium]|nr:hypothetical protein [Planctomycetota bacterium]
MSPSTLPARARAGALRPQAAGTLVAIATVVLLVSLPRLRDFALRENEGDAQRLVSRLGAIAEREGARSIRELIEGQPGLTRQLDDAEFLEEGRLLRRHGYLFDLAAGASEPSGASGASRAVRGWPWAHGRTGFAAFAWFSARGLTTHANTEGLWSGPDRPPGLEEIALWPSVERP